MLGKCNTNFPCFYLCGEALVCHYQNLVKQATFLQCMHSWDQSSISTKLNTELLISLIVSDVSSFTCRLAFCLYYIVCVSPCLSHCLLGLLLSTFLLPVCDSGRLSASN